MLNQLELHKKIDDFFQAGVDSANVDIAKTLLINDDAKRYFFSKADDSWIDWLWENGFLNEIKEGAEDVKSYSYRLPELDYLTKLAGKNPVKVSKIIKAVNISDENFNPEVVDRFLWIVESLPADQIKLLTVKIRDEKWLYLMRAFRKSGYEFEKLIKKLMEAGEAEALLEMAQALLVVKSKEEISENDAGFSTDSPFYVSDLGSSGIFEALANIAEPYREKALQITTGIIADMVKLAQPDESHIFDYSDPFMLYDIDYFTVKVENIRGYSQRKEVGNLAAVITKLIKATIGDKQTAPVEVKRLFAYIDELPTCRSVWRLRMFTLAQCPATFKEELKDAFFRLFEVDNYFEIEGGTEYKKALHIGFSYLSEADQRAYITQVFAYFQKQMMEDPEKNWIKRTGWEILSSICEYLTDNEAKKCEEIFGKKCNVEYEPKPTFGKARGGAVRHVSPVNLSDFTIEQIIENLKSKWAPEKLSEQFKGDDFLAPRGAEGLGDAMKENVKERTAEYLDKFILFFNREAIHSSYLYSLLFGIKEMLRDKLVLNATQIAQLFELFDAIKFSGEKTAFRRVKGDDARWLVDWITVHNEIPDILQHLLRDKTGREEIYTHHRERFVGLISYLFTIKDSPSKEEEGPEYGDPHFVAINSVRGQAFEALVMFAENDGDTLADDTKVLYKKVLTDDSLVMCFVIGRYLATFYFRGKEFIVELLPEIFPKDDPDKKDIYLASWEGYLTNTLYDKLFAALSDYYSHAIALDPKDYTERKYSKNLDESLAVHLALAYAHLELEIGSSLFIKFWNNKNVKRHEEFISFIGRSCLTRAQAGDEWLKENKVSKEKLIKFWDWALENVTEAEALAGFGFWINPDVEILDDALVIEKIAQTLKKSDGAIDWDHGLMRRLMTFAEKDGEKTLEIISSFLLDSRGDLNQNRRVPFFALDNEIKQSLEIIYKNGDTIMKQKVKDLINILIDKGSNLFWGLKDILN